MKIHPVLFWIIILCLMGGVFLVFKIGEWSGRYQILKLPVGVYQKVIHSKQSMEDFKKGGIMEDFKKGGINELVEDMRNIMYK